MDEHVLCRHVVDTLSHNVMCAQGRKCREKVSCEGVLSTEPVLGSACWPSAGCGWPLFRLLFGLRCHSDPCPVVPLRAPARGILPCEEKRSRANGETQIRSLQDEVLQDLNVHSVCCCDYFKGVRTRARRRREGQPGNTHTVDNQLESADEESSNTAEERPVHFSTN